MKGTISSSMVFCARLLNSEVPVEKLDLSESISMSPAAAAVFQLHDHELVKCVGEAYRMVDLQAPTVNLLPQTFVDGMRFAAQKPFFVAAAALVALAAVL